VSVASPPDRSLPRADAPRCPPDGGLPRSPDIGLTAREHAGRASVSEGTASLSPR
jgi:hypothetical protein